MNTSIRTIAFCLFATMMQAHAEEIPIYYGQGLCTSSLYNCLKITSGQSWSSLFPDPEKRDLVQRINRSYNSLWPGKVIAVPKDLDHANMLDLSPFTQKIDTGNEKLIIVDQDKLAWGAYDAQGQLVKWGPISSGRDKCSDSNNVCRTLTGIFRVFSKEGVKCKSDVFPIGKGGAKMPYCMYFHKGFALHGADDIPGYRASHGCVRMFIQDAKWLNEEFIDMASEKNNIPGTVVIVRPVTAGGKITIASEQSTVNNGSPKKGNSMPRSSVWIDPDRALLNRGGQ